MSKYAETKNFHSLTITLTIAFLILSVLVLLISSILHIYFSFQTQQEIVFEQQQLIAQNAANTVGEFFNEKFIVMETIVGFDNLAVAPQEEQEKALEYLLAIEPSFRQLNLLDLDKQEIAKANRLSQLTSYKLIDMAGDDFFIYVNGGKKHIGSVYINELTSEPLVVMSIPVNDIFGNVKSILMAEVNLKFIWNLVDELKIGETGLAYVVDRKGNLLAFGDITRVLRGENLNELNEVNKFINSQGAPTTSNFQITEGILNTQVASTHVPLNMPDWAVMVELPFSEAYETVFLGVWLTLIIVLLNIILAIVAGFFLSKRITGPIKKLTKTIENISIGKIDAEISPKLKESKDEIGALARAFERTIVSLKIAMNKTKDERNENVE